MLEIEEILISLFFHPIDENRNWLFVLERARWIDGQARRQIVVASRRDVCHGAAFQPDGYCLPKEN